ncbi:hypothetical protein EDB86DRAFT_2913648 [Lactarius hatsudake]|nr:hypothetical protein EDB86DRAFT_2913648 [Lactarius hatsudake]
MIFTMISLIASVVGTSLYSSSRLKKPSMRSKILTSASSLATTSFAAKRRTPAPAKMTFAGENTSPTPSPSATEKA